MQALSGMFPILLMFGIFYFILIRPQVKKQRETTSMLAKLGKGDEVITRGGIIGKITVGSEDGIVVLELQKKVRVRIPRTFIEDKWEGKVAEAAGAKSAA